VEVEDFQRYSEKVHTSLFECPIESSPLFLLHKKGKNSSKPKTSQNKKVRANFLIPSYSMHTTQDAVALWNTLTCNYAHVKDGILVLSDIPV
jgi:hypothetical protein